MVLVSSANADNYKQPEDIMKIIILGAGCPKYGNLYAEAEKAIAACGVKAELENEGIIHTIRRSMIKMLD
jgi:hypothetical protein